MRPRYTFDLAWSVLRFQAVAGRAYHLRAAHGWHNEGPVTLTLDRAAGLDHTLPATALEAGTAMQFFPPLMPVSGGAFYMLGDRHEDQRPARGSTAIGDCIPRAY